MTLTIILNCRINNNLRLDIVMHKRQAGKLVFERKRLTIMVVVLTVFLDGCIRRDRDGVKPEEIAKNFLIAVQKNDYATAIKYWNSDVSENLKNNSGLSFKEHCEKYFKCDSFELGRPYTGKVGYVFVDFSGELDGNTRGYTFPLHMVEGRWLLIENRIQPGLSESDNERGQAANLD